MAAHLAERDVEGVSAAFLHEPEATGGGFRLKEASLTFNPRVAGAGFLKRPPAGKPPAPAFGRPAARRHGRSENRGEDSAEGGGPAALLATFRAAGKITPAMESPLARLLSLGGAVAFHGAAGGGGSPDDDVDPAAEVAALLSALPTLLPRGGAVPAPVVGAGSERLRPGSGPSPEDAPAVRVVAARFGIAPEKVAGNL